jgi:hypothetical protein
MQGSLDLLVQGGSGLTNLHIGATDARLMTNSYVSAWTYDGSGTASNEIIRRDVMESYVANNGGSGTDTNAWHIGDSVTGAEDSVARAWGNHATNGYLTTGDGVGTVLRSYGTAQTELAISNGLRVVDGSIQSAITFQATNLPAGQIPLPPDINTGTGQITFSIGTNLPAASVVGNVTGAVYAATAGSAGSALSGWPTTWAGSAITSVVAQATSAANAANATNLNGQAAGYYLNGANITNVPAAWLATTQITWTATQNAGAQAVTNVATVGFTNSITLKSGSLGGTNGIYFTDNGTNYWILKPTL